MSTEITYLPRETILAKIKEAKQEGTYNYPGYDEECLLLDFLDVYNHMRRFHDYSLPDHLITALKADLYMETRYHCREYIEIMRKHKSLYEDMEVMVWIMKHTNEHLIDPELYAGVLAKFRVYNNNKPFDFYHRKLLDKFEARWRLLEPVVLGIYKHEEAEDRIFDIVACAWDSTSKDIMSAWEKECEKPKAEQDKDKIARFQTKLGVHVRALLHKFNKERRNTYNLELNTLPLKRGRE
jgi:hypothetical protein